MYFAQLVNAGGADRGGERDEMIMIYQNGASGKNWMRVNNGGGTFGDRVDIDVKDGCIIRGGLD